MQITLTLNLIIMTVILVCLLTLLLSWIDIYVWQWYGRLQNYVDKTSEVWIWTSFHSEILYNINETNLSPQEMNCKSKISNSNWFLWVEQMNGYINCIFQGITQGLMLFHVFIGSVINRMEAPSFGLHNTKFLQVVSTLMAGLSLWGTLRSWRKEW